MAQNFLLQIEKEYKFKYFVMQVYLYSMGLCVWPRDIFPIYVFTPKVLFEVFFRGRVRGYNI